MALVQNFLQWMLLMDPLEVQLVLNLGSMYALFLPEEGVCLSRLVGG